MLFKLFNVKPGLQRDWTQLDRVDQNVGRLLDKLERQGKLDNTLIFFASDNGACAEEPNVKGRSTDIKDFGTVASYESVGTDWATVQNTPLRFWKNYTHEGGICTPLIAHWPDQMKETGEYCREPVHFIDIMATFVDVSGADYPESFKGSRITPMQGTSLQPAFQGLSIQRTKPLYWKWKKGGGMRQEDSKAVFWDEEWELFCRD